MNEQDFVEEERGDAAFKRAVKRLLGVLEEHPQLWDRGDGRGGHVLMSVMEGAVALGFNTEGADGRPRSMVALLGKRDGWRCYYCRTVLAGDPIVPRPETDHVIPKCKGGADHIDNRVLTCAPCNNRKGTKSVEEFIFQRAKEVLQ